MLWLTFVTLLSGTTQPETADQQRPFLAQAQPNPAISVTEIRSRGKDHLGRDVQVIATTGKVLRLDVRVEGERFGQVQLDPLNYKHSGLTGMTVESDKDGGLIVRFPFGPPRSECFINYDGRDVLILTFRKQSKPVVAIQSYENCGIEE